MGPAALLLIGAMSALVAGCASGGGPDVVHSKGLTAAAYEPDGSSFDILAKGVIVAFPVGTTLSGYGTISVEGGGTFRVGDTVQYTGSDDKRDVPPRVPVAIPEGCPSDLDIWYFLPLTAK